MRTKITLSIVMSILVTAFTGFAGNYIGTITSIEGTATVKDAEGNSSRLQLNAPVYLQDEVTTEAGAKLQITFEDGTVFSQGEKSVMVINEYVYSPTNKKNNKALFGMVKGVFRVVTDQITKLNPAGFGVDTNYGTIGIRGCDLAFVITEDSDNVFIVELHTADSVVVNKDVTASSAAQEMVIRSGGILVAMDEFGMSQQPFPAAILKSLVEETTPNSDSADSAAAGTRAGSDALAGAGAAADAGAAAEAGTVTAADNTSTPLPLAAQVEQLVKENTSVDKAAAQAGTFVQNATASKVAEEIAAELAANIPVATAAATPLTVTPVPAGTDPVYPIVGPMNRQTVATGTDWSWGSWSQATTDLVDGTPVTTVAAGTFVSGTEISKPDFDAVQAGPRMNLSGTGAAGAAITEGGASTLVSGPALLNVSVGGGVAPVWAGDFNLSGNGAALSFESSGGIDKGALKGDNLSSYNLNTSKGSYSNPSGPGVSGNLVGPGNGARPITGAAGKFDFNHGANAPKVQGVFGADLVE